METREIIERLEQIIEDEFAASSAAICKQKIAILIDDLEELEEGELRDEVYGQFGFQIEHDSPFAPDLIAAAREGRKVLFVREACYIASREWLEEHFDDLGKIMELVCELADAKEATDAADVKEK